MIECTTLYRKKKLISKKDLKFRPAVYAIIVDDKKVLLVSLRNAKKYFLPGGGIEIGEKAEDALKREVVEEVGIKIKVKKFLSFKENFFYYDPWNEAYHGLSFFFLCKPETFNLVDGSKISGDEEEKPEWVNIKNLKENDFQIFGKEILEFLKE